MVAKKILNQKRKLIRFAHNWNDGILGTLVFHLVEKYYGSWDKQIKDY